MAPVRMVGGVWSPRAATVNGGAGNGAGASWTGPQTWLSSVTPSTGAGKRSAYSVPAPASRTWSTGLANVSTAAGPGGTVRNGPAGPPATLPE